MGISCDPDAHSLAPAERPPSDLAAQAFALCSEGADAGTLGQMGRRARVARRPWR